MNRVLAALAIFGTLLSNGVTAAETAQEKGFRIAAQSDRMDLGFGTSIAEFTMTLTNAAGKSTTRTLEIRTQEKPNEDVGDKSVTLFFTPPDVEGTALLSHAKLLESDDQWLYLPEISRVKRISSSNKSGPFVGSEFAFEDLTAGELGKYSYEWLEETSLEGMTVDKIKQVPLYKRSGYTHLLVYYDQRINQIRRVEFFNRGGRHFKTLTQSEFQNYGGTIHRPNIQSMENHLTGKGTVLKTDGYQFGVKLDDTQFKPAALTQL